MWTALAKGASGEIEESLAEIDCLQCRSDLSLLYNVAKSYLLELGGEDYYEELLILRKKIKALSEGSNSFSSVSSAQIAMMFLDIKLAKCILGKIAESEVTFPIYGWISIIEGKFEQAHDYFDKVLNNPLRSFDVLSLYGKALAYSSVNMQSECIQTYARILSKYNFPEIHIEKARLYVSMHKWTIGIETTRLIYDYLYNTMEADMIIAMQAIFQENNIKLAENYLGKCVEQCLEIESKNWEYQLVLAEAFSRICHKSINILNLTIKLVKTSHNIHPTPKSSAILAYHLLSLHDYINAYGLLEKINLLDEFGTNLYTHILLDTNRFVEAYDQLDFIQETLTDNLSYHLLKTKFTRLNNNNNSDVYQSLIASLIDHLHNIKVFKKTNNLTIELDHERILQKMAAAKMDYIIDALEELLCYDNQVPLLDDFFSKIIQDYFCISSVRFLHCIYLEKKGKYFDAMLKIEELMIGNWQSHPAHYFLLAASIKYECDEMKEAIEYLDAALNEDRSIEISRQFKLLRAKITGEVPVNFALTLNELVAFIDICNKSKDYESAYRYLIQASNMELTLNDKAKLISRQAYYFASKGKYEKAFKTLSKIRKRAQYREEALLTEAKIYIEFLNDIDKYLHCFEILINENPTTSHYELLGDALVNIDEYKAAAEAYNKAAPDENPLTLKKMIISLIKSHQFKKLYNLGDYNNIPLEYLDFLIKSKKYESAIIYAANSMRKYKNQSKLSVARYTTFLALIQYENSQIEASLQSFKKVMAIYESILDGKKENYLITSIKQKAADVLYYIGRIAEKSTFCEHSQNYFKQSADLDPTNEKSFHAIFSFYKARQNLSKCFSLCCDFLKNSPHSENVALMLTSVESKNFNESIIALENVLDCHPHFHRLLVRLIEICARAGKLFIAKKRLDRLAIDNSGGAAFARGIYSMYSGEQANAMKNFQLALQNRLWHDIAERHIFSLLVNPERKYIWCETNPLAPEESLLKAEELLKKFKLSDIDRSLLEAEILASKNQNDTVLKAKCIYKLIYKNDNAFIPAIVGIARCNIRLGKDSKADIYVEKVLLSKPLHETFSYFEESYLMRSAIITKDWNFRTSQHFIFLAIDLNMSSKKAWEMSGYIHKQNKMYSEAAIAYGKCWELGGKSNLSIGYEYAFCSLKAGKSDDALVTCRYILEADPFYPNIQDQILIPAFKVLHP